MTAVGRIGQLFAQAAGSWPSWRRVADSGQPRQPDDEVGLAGPEAHEDRLEVGRRQGHAPGGRLGLTVDTVHEGEAVEEDAGGEGRLAGLVTGAGGAHVGVDQRGPRVGARAVRQVLVLGADALGGRTGHERVVGRVAGRLLPAVAVLDLVPAAEPGVPAVAEEVERPALRVGHHTEAEDPPGRGAVTRAPLGERPDAVDPDPARHAASHALPPAALVDEEVDARARPRRVDDDDLGGVRRQPVGQRSARRRGRARRRAALGEEGHEGDAETRGAQAHRLDRSGARRGRSRPARTSAGDEVLGLRVVADDRRGRLLGLVLPAGLLADTSMPRRSASSSWATVALSSRSGHAG